MYPESDDRAYELFTFLVKNMTPDPNGVVKASAQIREVIIVREESLHGTDYPNAEEAQGIIKTEKVEGEASKGKKSQKKRAKLAGLKALLNLIREKKARFRQAGLP
ncbi:MAG: hypothetical protein LBC41_01140 [Clostridiales bacterium]|jgi:hypothetical protein|nr:hypothetical protein [Clostridiales bacterium]